MPRLTPPLPRLESKKVSENCAPYSFLCRRNTLRSTFCDGGDFPILLFAGSAIRTSASPSRLCKKRSKKIEKSERKDSLFNPKKRREKSDEEGKLLNDSTHLHVLRYLHFQQQVSNAVHFLVRNILPPLILPALGDSVLSFSRGTIPHVFFLCHFSGECPTIAQPLRRSSFSTCITEVRRVFQISIFKRRDFSCGRFAN